MILTGASETAGFFTRKFSQPLEISRRKCWLGLARLRSEPFARREFSALPAKTDAGVEVPMTVPPSGLASPFRGLAHRPYLLLSLTSLFWAGNIVLGRYVAGHVPPVALSFFRWAGAFLILLALAWPHLRADWPTIQLRYRIESKGAVIKSGEARVADMNYLRHRPRYDTSDLIRYEKQMLDEWFNRTLREPAADSKP